MLIAPVVGDNGTNMAKIYEVAPPTTLISPIVSL